jgi:hypothetical protein
MSAMRQLVVLFGTDTARFRQPGQDSDEVDEAEILHGIYMDFTLVVSSAWHSLFGVWAAGRVAHDTTNEGPAHLPGLSFCG